MSKGCACSTLLADALGSNATADLALLIVSHPELAAGPCSGILSNRSMLKLWYIARGGEASPYEAAIVRIVGEALLIEEMS